MVNTDDFIKRLEILLDYYSLSASVFADKIGVQRSSLSHLLSGRNKPSLDFILKIIEGFPEVDLYWILNGKGSFPKSEHSIKINSTPTTPLIPIEKVVNKTYETPNLFNDKVISPINKIENNFSDIKIPTDQRNESEIDRIVIFYKDGTFKNYIPQ